jgi:quercetin dioxygenase-like cupin family protein
MHQHPQEQWGIVVRGSLVRFLGDEKVDMKAGDFYQTPGNIPHGMVAGPEGATVIDIFAPPRKEYLTPGSGYGSASVAKS